MCAQNGKFLQFASTFLGGFAVAFSKSWKLTLVMVATIPLLILSGGLMAKVMSRTSSQGQEAYAEAGTTVEQVVGSIRTVRKPHICLRIQSSQSDSPAQCQHCFHIMSWFKYWVICCFLCGVPGMQVGLVRAGFLPCYGLMNLMFKVIAV